MGPCGTGQGMMHGYGMGPCGTGQGMMRGYGMGPGMMQRNLSPETYRDFFDQTRELRKQLHDLRFDYQEALRSPEDQGKNISELEQKMFDLQQQIREKAYNTFGGTEE
jgi:hypothetical protein